MEDMIPFTRTHLHFCKPYGASKVNPMFNLLPSVSCNFHPLTLWLLYLLAFRNIPNVPLSPCKSCFLPLPRKHFHLIFLFFLVLFFVLFLSVSLLIILQLSIITTSGRLHWPLHLTSVPFLIFEYTFIKLCCYFRSFLYSVIVYYTWSTPWLFAENLASHCYKLPHSKDHFWFILLIFSTFCILKNTQ